MYFYRYIMGKGAQFCFANIKGVVKSDGKGKNQPKTQLIKQNLKNKTSQKERKKNIYLFCFCIPQNISSLI